MKDIPMDNRSRCTFAIISHPDAGKTTVTEKLLWFGGVIRKAGMVKSKSGDFAKSDWMELEKQRGISITSSVMSFEYADRAVHLLDTPGHKDFSEDTYRTLTAVESVLMMIDGAKGVEEQTIKLMDVCRLRDTPIVTFMNKFDRDAMDPFALIDNVESILKIQCVPLTWPVGDGVDFKGVYDLKNKVIRLFNDAYDPFSPTIIDASNLESDICKKMLGPKITDKLQQDLMMVDELIGEFHIDEYLAGIQSPVFFGSALYNFGVKEVLDQITAIAPGPRARKALVPPFDAPKPVMEEISPENPEFSGFIFKIQANMDKKHRDRVAFLRVCSGEFTRNTKIFHVRSERELKIPSPLIFQAQDREIVEKAYAGDIIGLHDTGKFQIGDTFTSGRSMKYTGIPSFAPEIFMKVVLKDPMKAKHLEKGLQQLSEEGAAQLFYRPSTNEKLLGAVGALQFEVVKFRLEDEYNVLCDYQPAPFVGVRWVRFATQDSKEEVLFRAAQGGNLLEDIKGRLCFGIKSQWDFKLVVEKFPSIEFFNNSDYQTKHSH
ncbi:MAG: peptide chain release factor 3 [Bacteriovoracaceae bacterium]|nr:peptide chain release factor 3 [Bacteriovoracaceae bacterium]